MVYEYDNFGQDSGLWDFSTTNGSKSFLPAIGGLQFVHSALGWAQVGLTRATTPGHFAYGDQLVWLVKPTVLDNPTDFGSTFQSGWLNSHNLSGGGSMITAYCYNTPGGTAPTLHGQSLGVANELSPAGNIAVDNILQFTQKVGASPGGQLTGQALGGPFVSATNYLTGNGVDVTAYDIYPQVAVYGDMTLLVLGYIWCDVNGYAPNDIVDLSFNTAFDTQLTADWTLSNLNSANGYQMQASKSPSFTAPITNTVSQNGPQTGEVGGLDSGTLYYLRVRLFITLRDITGGFTDYYSGWSNVVTGTTTGNPPVTGSDGENLLALGEL